MNEEGKMWKRESGWVSECELKWMNSKIICNAICTHPQLHFLSFELWKKVSFFLLDQEKMQCNWKFTPFIKHFFLLTSFCAFFPTFFLQFNIQSADAVLLLWRKQNKCKNLLTISKYIRMKYNSIWRKKKIVKASFTSLDTAAAAVVVAHCCCSSFFILMCVLFFFLSFLFSFQFIFHAFKRSLRAHIAHEVLNRIWNFLHFLKWKYDEKKVSNISFPLWYRFTYKESAIRRFTQNEEKSRDDDSLLIVRRLLFIPLIWGIFNRRKNRPFADCQNYE